MAPLRRAFPGIPRYHQSTGDANPAPSIQQDGHPLLALSEQLLHAHLETLPHRRATFKQLLRELHVRGGERQELKNLLHQMVRARRLVETRHHFELPPAPKPAAAAPARRTAPSLTTGDLTGRISIHRDGFAFVLPDVDRKGVAGDIFIPPPFVGSAMHGDTVEVKIVKKNVDGHSEGRVLRIVRRAHATVVGEFHFGPRYNYIRPIDDRLRDPILIPRGCELPTGQSQLEVHRVLGQEARTVRERAAQSRGSRRHGAMSADPMEGAVVDVEITQYPTSSTEARGKVIEVLGYRDDFGVDVEIMIRKHHLPHRFPPEVLAEAESVLPTIPAEEIARRRDFRHLPIVTIDGETAKDFDDAVYVAHRENGNFELQVHIADVSYYVQPDSAIDREARLRGTSVYFPDRAVPMLPTQLSTDLCSLRPREDRLVMSCIMEITPEGDVVDYELMPGIICSAERMTYTDVNAVLTGDEAARKRYALLVPIFERMATLQGVLNRRRVRRGSIDFDLPEPAIAFDEMGLMRSIMKSERNIAHRIIEEFMLAAAETVARHLEALGVPSVYRIHEKPDPKKVMEFEEIAASFGYTLGVGPIPVRRVQKRIAGRLRSFEIPLTDELKISPRHYQKLTAKLAGKPEERILSYLMLRSLKQARYDGHNVGHFALATDTYTHFTSPIRRYPDLMVHRILKAVLAAGVAGTPSALPDGPGKRRRKRSIAEPPPPGLTEADGLLPIEQIQRMAREASEAERRADDAERELLDWKKVRYMETRMGEEFPALILHVTRNGFFIELTDLFIDGFVPIDVLDDDRYSFREADHALVGAHTGRRFRLGDRITVTIDRIDPVLHKIHFAPLIEEMPKKKRR